MKRFYVFLLSTLMVGTTLAQTPNVVNFKALEKKIVKSNQAIQNEKQAVKYSTWLTRGELFIKVYDAMTLSAYNGMSISDFNILIGMPLESSDVVINDLNLKKYKMERTDFFFLDDYLMYWNYAKPLYDNPFEEAYKSLRKVGELDEKGKSNKKIKPLYERLKYQFITEGSIEYAKKDYAKSYDYFVKAIEIGEMPLVGYVDTLMLYYAGLSAQLIGDYDNALKYYEKSIKYQLFMDGNVYYNAYDACKTMEKAPEGLKYLEDGFVKFPKNQNILYSLIDYYLQRGENPDKIIDYIDQANENEENATLYFAKATLLDNLGNFDGAIENYMKAVELDPEYFDAVFNLGVIYFNRGVGILDEASKLPPKEIEKYDELIVKSNNEFKKSLPYMERALEISPDNIQTLESLRNLYFRFRVESEEYMKKYQEINLKWSEKK